MWIEEMFGDLKGHGFDLEKTRLRQPGRQDLSIFRLGLDFIHRCLIPSQIVFVPCFI